MDPRHRFIQRYSRQGLIAGLAEFSHEKSRTAASDEFTALSQSIAMHIAVLNLQSTPWLLRQRYDKDPTVTVAAAMSGETTELDDRIAITRFVRWDAQGQPPSLLKPATVMRQRRG